VAVVRRQFLRLAGAALAAPSVSRLAWSQTYPVRPVRMIVPVAAGGPIDSVARIVAQKLSERWDNKVYVENLPTGAGNVAAATAAKAPADGYTVLVVTTGFVINPGLYAKLPYDPINDFAPVTLVWASPHVLLVHPSLPATTVKELVALVRASPGSTAMRRPAPDSRASWPASCSGSHWDWISCTCLSMAAPPRLLRPSAATRRLRSCRCRRLRPASGRASCAPWP
jgi:tripartite-type tricarboxylate transporter receptor subunit TctC